MTLDIALTGGIGSGKSTTANELKDLGAVIIDADVLAREVVEPGTPALAQISATFGTAVLTGEGGLDRAALADIVFADDDARRALNAIVHPAVRRAGEERRAAALASDPRAIVIQDIPLLAESGQAPSFHGVIVVHTPLPLRLERLESRGMTEAEARARIAAQASDEEREAIADVLLHNDGDLAHLRRQVGRLWREWLVPYRDALAGTREPAPAAAPPAAPPAAARDRALGRVRAALAETGARAELRDPSTAEITGAPGELAEAMRRAGFVPAGPGEFASADPRAPLRALVR